MRLRNVIASSTLAAIVVGTMVGCNQGTEVGLAPAPAIKPADSSPLPKDKKQGGGATSSGNMQRNPGASS